MKSITRFKYRLARHARTLTILIVFVSGARLGSAQHHRCSSARQALGRRTSADTATTLVLVHGFNSSTQKWRALDSILGAAGATQHCVVRFGWQTSVRGRPASLSESADALANQLRAIDLQRDGPIYIVAHSAGGLVAWAALGRLLDAGNVGLLGRVHEVLTLGTPINGTRLSSRLGGLLGLVGTQHEELRPGSKAVRMAQRAVFLLTLRRRSDSIPDPRVQVLCEGAPLAPLMRQPFIAAGECNPGSLFDLLPHTVGIDTLSGVDHESIAEPSHESCRVVVEVLRMLEVPPASLSPREPASCVRSGIRLLEPFLRLRAGTVTLAAGPPRGAFGIGAGLRYFQKVGHWYLRPFDDVTVETGVSLGVKPSAVQEAHVILSPTDLPLPLGFLTRDVGVDSRLRPSFGFVWSRLDADSSSITDFRYRWQLAASMRRTRLGISLIGTADQRPSDRLGLRRNARRRLDYGAFLSLNLFANRR
jgi:pimeloyl-ACP methyl ester carboxylesterase